MNRLLFAEGGHNYQRCCGLWGDCALALNRILFGCLVTLAASATGVSVVAARHVPTIRANTYVGPIPVGGLSAEEAALRLRIWWESAKLKKLKLEAADLKGPLPEMTPGQLGVTLDDQACVAKLPLDDLKADVTNVFANTAPARLASDPVFKPNGVDLHPLAATIKSLAKAPHPARAVLVDGQVTRVSEVAPQELDMDAVPQAVIKILPDGDTVELPIKSGPKHVPDDALGKITDVVGEFSTHFSTSKRTRCWNIRLASGKLRGLVLMPGDRLSFNGTVGRRTLRAGFKLAGVYKNGKHDVGIGGGICQVSTTLYNACLFSNLKIRQRSNHSLPVPYVPLGRDATVDYGDLDLVVENTYATPIAIDSTYEPGRLTFRVLGEKDPSLSVHLIQSGLRSWDPGVKTVIDRSLKPGKKRIVEKGNWGHSVATYRLVYKDGHLVRRELLSHSTYGGHARVVAFNPAQHPAHPPGSPVIAPPPPGPATPPSTGGAPLNL